jgi:hypothetical protein
MPGDLREKLKLMDILDKILKNSKYLDTAQIYADIENLKSKINTLLDDVLGVEHEIDEIHNYDDTNLQRKIQDAEAPTESLRSELEFLANRLEGIRCSEDEIEIKNSQSIKTTTLDSGFNQSTIKILPGQINLQVSQTQNNKLYGQLSLGGGSTDSGVSISSDNTISLTTRTLDHYVNVTKDINEISDVNGFVFEASPSPKAAGIRIKTFNNEHYLDIPWDA